MTPNSIIDAVRVRLGDVDKERWNDNTLLLYVSLCQKDICTFTRFYRKEVDIELVSGQLLYDLPTDCLTVNRFEYNCHMLPVESRNIIDKGDALFPCILKDNIPYNQIEFVLCRRGQSRCNDTGIDECSGLFLFNALANAYGVVTDSNTDQPLVPCELDDAFGVVTNVEPSEGIDCPECPTDLYNVRVFYTAVPPTIPPEDMDVDVYVPDIWFQAFLHFVEGMALQDDNDANNISRGQLEESKYQRLLIRINQIASKDFTSSIPSKLMTSIRKI